MVENRSCNSLSATMAPTTKGSSKEKKSKDVERKDTSESKKSKKKPVEPDIVEEKTRTVKGAKMKGPVGEPSRDKTTKKTKKDDEKLGPEAGGAAEEVSNRPKRKRTREEQQTLEEEVPTSKRRKAGEDVVTKKATSKKRNERSPSVSGHSRDQDQEQAKSDQEAEDEVYLHGFSTDEDSSDDESIDVDPLDVSKLPNAARDDKSVKSRLDRAKKKQTEERGVLYLGRIPHGFYEDQMKEYFSQFGNVTRLRISRNKKTGKSKHYGFIEFDSVSVARIVSETMDNYLLAGHLLQCKVVPPERVHPELWVGANRKWRKLPAAKMNRLGFNKERTAEEKARAEERLLKRQKERAEKIKAAGIKYSLDKVGYKPIKA